MKILLGLAVIAVFTVGVIEITGQPGFCNSCHIMNSYYDSWKRSPHASVNCLHCHLQPGFTGFVKGKINGLAQAVDCIVGRVGTKPNATIDDASCLRHGCHNVEEITAKTLDYKNVRFTHKYHVNKVVDGIKISCGMCHSHFEGEEHFTINSEVCFTCHFLKSEEKNDRLVQTTCRSCHKVPDKVIERGLVKVNHAEFVSYKASCEDSCHKKEIEKLSNVSESVCLNCHSFSKGDETDSMELHQIHSSCEKVECFACHGKVSHGSKEVQYVSEMMDCKSCHSDTHNVQISAYTASRHPLNKETGRILSPMFLTHVECTGCHIKPEPVERQAIGSIGKVAKAVPKACDRCHELGTGRRYIPFWQGKIKRLHQEVGSRLKKLQAKAQSEVNKAADRGMREKIQQVKSLLDMVESDGSWGVHNLKYTEAMLLKANELITEAQN